MTFSADRRAGRTPSAPLREVRAQAQARSVDCNPPREARVWSSCDKKKLRKTLPSKQEAIKWRRKHLGLAESGQLRTPVRITLGEVAYLWTEWRERNRSGKKYVVFCLEWHPFRGLPGALAARSDSAREVTRMLTDYERLSWFRALFRTSARSHLG